MRNRFDPLDHIVGQHLGVRSVWLLDGSVLLTGGRGADRFVRTAQIFEPETTP
jgi:hypothetical protein